MHQRVLGERDDAAQKSILESGQKLAEYIGLESSLVDALSVQERDPAIRVMLQREAVADLLRNVLTTVEQSQTESDEAAVSALQEQIARLNEQVTMLAGDEEAARVAMVAKDARIAELENEVSGLKDQLEEADSKIGEFEDEKANSDNAAIDYDARLQEKDAKIAELEAQIESLTAPKSLPVDAETTTAPIGDGTPITTDLPADTVSPDTATDTTGDTVTDSSTSGKGKKGQA